MLSQGDTWPWSSPLSRHRSLTTFCDSDWTGNTYDRKSIIVYLLIL